MDRSRYAIDFESYRSGLNRQTLPATDFGADCGSSASRAGNPQSDEGLLDSLAECDSLENEPEIETRPLNSTRRDLISGEDEAFLLVGNVTFPEASGLNVNMMPFTMGDKTSLPEE